ncbi:MAG: hypothetical protein HYY77_24895 [Betaproteobacteria bacterium]|nr:hypothetical protein [Betaproteobacteria bacterium]
MMNWARRADEIFLIASIYGMNFRHLPELEWYFGYPLALVLMLIVAIGPILYLKRKGWL